MREMRSMGIRGGGGGRERGGRNKHIGGRIKVQWLQTLCIMCNYIKYGQFMTACLFIIFAFLVSIVRTVADVIKNLLTVTLR